MKGSIQLGRSQRKGLSQRVLGRFPELQWKVFMGREIKQGPALQKICGEKEVQCRSNGGQKTLSLCLHGCYKICSAEV